MLVRLFPVVKKHRSLSLVPVAMVICLLCTTCCTKNLTYIIFNPHRNPAKQRLRDGVIRDIERQNRKKENIRLLGEQIILTEQLEAEREKTLAKDLKKHDLK
ncbi:PET117 cytochrome c oxidase chaperone [Phyllostomus discolor]|uniref:PET117 cytochrome c oxidase chaperone n=1 Tax=Phyllostomus discolor TaxID=89673 RepID=A0A833ZC07_9CHIR|nr:PET117 cytochrome c oxidase chaperone [Phyllostomus discolor]